MKPKTKFTILAILIIALTIFFTTTPAGEYIKPDQLREYVVSFGPIAPVVYMLLYIIGAVVGFPGSVLSLTGGLAFGATFGTIYAVIGATLGASAAFFVARYMGRDFVRKLMGKKAQKLDLKIEKHGLGLILFTRIVPLFPFNFLNFAFGLSKVRFRDFFIGTAIGIIPGTFAYVYLGSSLTDIFSKNFAIAIILLLALSLIPKIYKRFKK